MNKTKTKIVIASVLKPVDDVRNYKKIASSLAANENYRIIILGIGGNSQPESSQIIFKSWRKFNRLSFDRLRVQRAFWKTMKQEKPDLIICTTFELLLTSVLFRSRHQVKIIYDIQEDYLKNLWHQKFYPTGLRHVVGLSIRAMEWALSPFISGFTLAEKTYQNDIRFVRKKFLILENKSLPISPQKISEYFKVIFTGTITSYSRAKESIELYLQIKDQLPGSTLTVIGHVPVSNYQKLLEHSYHDTPNVALKLSSNPIAHGEIVDEISSANLGIIGYLPNPVNVNKIPTKLYEYTAAKLPYLVQNETTWSDIGAELGGVIPIDLTHPDGPYIKDRLANITISEYAKNGYLWREDEEKLSKFIHAIISQFKHPNYLIFLNLYLY